MITRSGYISYHHRIRFITITEYSTNFPYTAPIFHCTLPGAGSIVRMCLCILTYSRPLGIISMQFSRYHYWHPVSIIYSTMLCIVVPGQQVFFNTCMHISPPLTCSTLIWVCRLRQTRPINLLQ